MDLLAGLDRGHRGAASGEQRASVQRVPAVVPGACEHRDPRAVDPAWAAWTAAQQLRAHRCQSRGRALHERAIGDQRHQRGFRRADLGYLVSVTHAA
jgi:hypothetical protein